MLLLFDIDGTLLQKASREHAVAIRQAASEVHDVDLVNGPHPGPQLAGRTDGEIARILLLSAGVDAAQIDERASAVMDRACELYVDLCPATLVDKLVPGIDSVLGWLSGQDDVLLALVTGNYEPIARLKLKRAGVGHYFPEGQGGFGSDAEDRAALPTIARRRANGMPKDQAVVIGDTPRDIACARADGIRCVAVTTGPYSAEELTAADAVVSDSTALQTTLLTMIASPV